MNNAFERTASLSLSLRTPRPGSRGRSPSRRPFAWGPAAGRSRREVLVTLCRVGLPVLCLLAAGCGRGRPAPAAIEKRFARADKILLMAPYSLPAETTVRSIIADTTALATHQLYLKPRGDRKESDYLHVDGEGAVFRKGDRVSSVSSHVELLITRNSRTFFVDDVPVAKNLADWEVYWVADSESKPPVKNRNLPRMRIADGFMRHELPDGNCRITAGSVKLSQRGGGMPRNMSEARNAGFQRAVNPFSVVGQDHAVLGYEKDSSAWTDYLAEARFYFGVPKSGDVVDVNTLPTDTDMLVAQGAQGHNQVAFGWCGDARDFVLMARARGEEWTILERMSDGRPPLTNWAKIGIEVVAGHRVRAFLDDVLVLSRDLDMRVGGGFHILTGAGPAEFDDVQAWSVPRPREKGSPLVVESRNFADKKKRERNDPSQFGEWAESSAVFRRVRGKTADGGRRTAIVTAQPLRGDFFYESEPLGDGVLPLPKGEYEFALYSCGMDGRRPDIDRSPAVLKLYARRGPTNWFVHSLAADLWPTNHCQPTLRFRRYTEDDQCIALQVSGDWRRVSEPVAGTVYMSVARLHPAGSYVFYPKPYHHVLFCANVVNELFEQAPSDWSWVEGAFRMDCRWACNVEWNFMTCGSPGVPWMAGKRTFRGDQAHEYYVSLRSVFPWDAGDLSFDYDPDEDRERGFPIMRENGGWYNRRDLNFSFCCDGRNPLSGYAVVFGGSDNTETRLLRKGKTVAATREPDFLFPGPDRFLDLHWSWWRFVVTKTGNRIRVALNDEELFDYVDDEPPAGGHIGFWSVRNGFALARVTSSADRIGWNPQVMYVQDDAPAPWCPLPRDSAVLTREEDTGLVSVTATSGAGFHALRHTPEKPVDLEAMPVMSLPLALEPRTIVNLHLFVGGASYLLEISAPVPGMKSLLTPDYERGECFRVPLLEKSTVKTVHHLGRAQPLDGLMRIDLRDRIGRMTNRPPQLVLTAMTLGNTSNDGYLLAGGTNGAANAAGPLMRVGTPTFSSE